MRDDYKYKFLDDEAATSVKTGNGALHAIVVGSTPSGAIEIYDATGSGGTKIGELKSSIVEGTYEFNCLFGTGLYIENKGKGKITVIYR